jgi:light-regulated signal transduction histidine kinase (bacteriophytochrome)
VSDITVQKISEGALIRANKKLKLLTQITRHDIANDLSLAYGSLDLLKEKIALTPDSYQYIRYLRESIDAISSKINFTRSYEQMGTQKPFWQHLSSVVKEVHDLNPRFSAFTLHDSLGDLEIFADLMLPKVIANLFDNSVRHGMTVSTIALSYHITENGCDIVYEDDGVGFGEI